MRALNIPVAALTATVALVVPASGETYRIVNSDNRSQFVLADCAKTPSAPTLDWIRQNCREVPKSSAVGPIADVLYSAAGNSADAPSGGFTEIYGWSHEVQSPRDSK